MSLGVGQCLKWVNFRDPATDIEGRLNPSEPTLPPAPLIAPSCQLRTSRGRRTAALLSSRAGRERVIAESEAKVAASSAAIPDSARYDC